MDLHDLPDIQQVAPAVNGFEESALDIDRALLCQGSGLQLAVEGCKDLRLVFLCTGDEPAVIGLDHVLCRGHVQAEGLVLLDALSRCTGPC